MIVVSQTRPMTTSEMEWFVHNRSRLLWRHVDVKDRKECAMVQPLMQGAVRLATFVLVAIALVISLVPLHAAPVAAQDDDAEADATLRVIHASPGAPEVDVLVDGQTLLQGLAYGTASSYATITPEEHRLQVVPTGQTADAAVVDETIDAAPGQAYLLAVFGLLNDIGGDIYDGDLSEIQPGKGPV